MGIRFMAAMAAIAILAACGPQNAAKPSAEAAAPASGCADDGPRFPGTDICLARASSYMDPARLAVAPPDLGTDVQGCEWVINQTMLAGDEAVLYRALRCNGKTATLAYAGGARSASLTLATAARGAAGEELVRIFTSDAADPQGSIRALIADAPEAERPKCEVQPAGREDWPADALVISYSQAFQRELDVTGIDAVCGGFGLDEGAQTYWLLRGGYAWFVSLGQEVPEIDAGTITLLRKGPDGTWAAVE